MGTERSRGLYQLRVMHPNLARPASRATGLDQKAITFLLLRRHLVIRDLGVAAEGWCLGHIGLPSGWIGDSSCNGTPALSTRWGHRFGSWTVWPQAKGFAADAKSETMAITDPGIRAMSAKRNLTMAQSIQPGRFGHS